MSDKLIRELLVDVKQKGASRTAKSIEKVSDALENAAAASELTNEQLGKMPKTLYSIERAADRAAKSLIKVQVNRNMTAMSAQLTAITTKLDTMANAMLHAADVSETGFNDMVKSVGNMSNDVVASSERIQDSFIDLNRHVKTSGKGFDGTAAAGNRASRAIGNTSGAARGATRDFAAMAKIGGTLPIMYAAIASNIFVLQSAFEQLKAGDQLNRLMDFGTIVGSTTGVPVQNLARALQEATGYAVSFEEAMKQASSAAAYGFTADQISDFALVARRAAAVLGVDMTDALNRVIKGISKQEIELMDELGITIRLNDAYAEYVKKLNAANTGVQYNTQSLSSYQKQQAYANAVVAQSTKLFGNLDSVLRATPWEQFGANADTALKRVQMAAAKYLTPVANMLNNIFYQSRIAQMGEDALAQAATNINIDPKNTTAMVNSFVETRDQLTKMEATTKGFNIELSRSQEELDRINKKLTVGTKLYGLGMGGSLANAEGPLAPDKEQLALLERRSQLEAKISQMEKEKSNVMQTRAVLQNNLEERTNALLKAQPSLMKKVEQSGKTIVDPNKVKVLQDLTNSASNFAKNIAPNVTSAFNDMTDVNNVGQVVSSLSDVSREVEQQAKLTGASADEIVKKYGLGVNTVKELNDKLDTAKSIQTLMNNETQDQIALEEKRNQLLKAGTDSKKATIAVNNMEIQQINTQISAYEKALQVNGKSPALEKKINDLKLKRLQITNSQFSQETKIKDKTDKILGVDREIALINDRSMNATEYRLAQLNLELEIEKEKYAWYSKQADKQAETFASRRAQASIEREIWTFQQEQLKADIERKAGGTELASRQANLGPMESLRAQIAAENTRIAELQQAGISLTKEEVANHATRISELQQQIKEIETQNQQRMRDSVTSSVGGTYSTTFGMDAETAAQTDMSNRLASYDEAISKLGELNSQAMAVGQSMGNLTNAMIQFSQGSLDTTSMIAAGMQTVSTMINAGVSQQVSAIDQAIAAEQKRDGKSEASKNKIKKMEAEKLKIQQDAAKKQIIIQTAVAVMQAATAVPYPFSIPLMVAAGLAGAMALAQASSASGMSSIGDAGGDTASYLTLGERQKNIDVSMGASGGELSYIRGEKGMGGSGSFIPRAEGGNMYPGVSYQTGEHGTEVITPTVPMKATPNDELGKGSGRSSGRPIMLNVQALDAQSFVDFAMNNSAVFQAAVENALNEEGASLKTLRQN